MKNVKQFEFELSTLLITIHFYFNTTKQTPRTTTKLQTSGLEQAHKASGEVEHVC